ncbi:transglutaminase TgpA family protein [Cytobacillus sp. Hm23]
MIRQDELFNVRNIVLYLFSLFLLWEWLRPLTLITDTGSISLFLVFLVICLLLLYFRIRFWLSLLITGLIMFYMLHTTYQDGSFFQIELINLIYEEISYNISMALDGNWTEMTGYFRSLLFFILLWMMCYLMHYWIVHQKRIFTFFVLTIIYTTVIDTFTPYEAEHAIVRILVIGLIMISFLYYERTIDTELLNNNRRDFFLKWLLPTFAVVVVSAFVGFLVPKAEPQWPDPVPYLKSYVLSNDGTGSGVKKVGFSSDSSQLGGPFIPDDEVVFTVEASEKHYWRIETEDVYTGKGWVSSESSGRRSFDRLIEVYGDWWSFESVEQTPVEAQINMMKQQPFIVYPLGLTSIEGVPLEFNQTTERLYVERDSEFTSLTYYRTLYNLPEYSVEALQNAKPYDASNRFIYKYLQLPDTLPTRVRDLAKEITEGKETQYDKVKAVESYFDSVNFQYETEDVAIPGEEEDYVDQFLFETMKGYCDNFSTSMVVLLRSLDIPARWVKGFTNGEKIKHDVYEVTNNNAHSWVEVYFEEIGWVTFEPTKGFTNPYDFRRDINRDAAEVNVPEVQSQQPELLQEEEVEEEEANKYEVESSSNISIPWKPITIVLIVATLMFFILRKTRLKWYPSVMILLYKNRRDEVVYFKAYAALLKQLAVYGLGRKEGQTLRAYAAYIDSYFGHQQMTELTKSYERALYRKDNAQDEWEKSVELWENLIKKTAS